MPHALIATCDRRRPRCCAWGAGRRRLARIGRRAAEVRRVHRADRSAVDEARPQAPRGTVQEERAAHRLAPRHRRPRRPCRADGTGWPSGCSGCTRPGRCAGACGRRCGRSSRSNWPGGDWARPVRRELRARPASGRATGPRVRARSCGCGRRDGSDWVAGADGACRPRGCDRGDGCPGGDRCHR